MKKHEIHKNSIRAIIIITTIITFLYCNILYSFPPNLMLIEGKEYVFDLGTPMSIGITADKSNVLKLNGNDVNNNYKLNLGSSFKVKSDKSGIVNLKLKLFGAIPFKTVTVNVLPETMVVPCGNTVGVKIYTKGVLIVGISDITGVDGKLYRPCSCLEEGDIVLSVNGNYLDSALELSEIINASKGNPVDLKINRNSNIINYRIIPISTDDNKYKIGLWVRDSTSGIGTLTFYSSNTKKFGALGHGITDVDTGTLLTVGKGDILESSIIAINKGLKGSPGELKGIFLNEDFKIGDITDNNECGIYGQIVTQALLPQNPAISVALRNEIKEGPAVILSNIDGKKVESYTIDIQKVFLNNYHNSKSMIIKVTDPRLIEMTGGIVQGMSGSPIIQDNKLVGAVTHVFVNDPTRGYGVFAELMLQNVNQ